MELPECSNAVRDLPLTLTCTVLDFFPTVMVVTLLILSRHITQTSNFWSIQGTLCLVPWLLTVIAHQSLSPSLSCVALILFSPITFKVPQRDVPGAMIDPGVVVPQCPLWDPPSGIQVLHG